MADSTMSDDNTYLFTSESVADGHPDKICDQVSDAVLDACLEIDPFARVAVETAVKGHDLILLGEVSGGTRPGDLEWCTSDVEYDGRPL